MNRRNSFLSRGKHDLWLPDEEGTDEFGKLATGSLTQPHYNTVMDVHATMSAANVELIFSTNGNWYKALGILLERYFEANPSVKNSYLITTSPPISMPQMDHGSVRVGNVMWTDAHPHVAAGPLNAVKKLEDANRTIGNRIPIIRTYGCVILKRKGDERINTFWDLRSLEPGRFTTSHPAEGGSYNNYRSTTRNIALNNPRVQDLCAEEGVAEAEELENFLFDEGNGIPRAGHIMHRSIPHVIATGKADAALCFFHIAVATMKDNPGVFEAVYLAKDKVASTDDPVLLAQGQDPLPGTQIGEFFVVRTTTAVNDAQERARESFVESLKSPEFTAILAECGLRRPE